MEPVNYNRCRKNRSSQYNKFMGLDIGKFLGWDEHVNHVLSKVSSGFYALR